MTIFLDSKTPATSIDSTLDHSHVAIEVQLGENAMHMRKQCDTYAKLEIRTDTTLKSHV